MVADEADSHVECNCVGVKAGRTYTARQLLDALLLVSGNDAANTLAHMLGGQEAAVAKMDAKAASLGAVNTHASTPSGLDGPGGSGWSTAHDLAVIFRAAMANPVFAQITAEPSRDRSRAITAITRSATRTSCCSATRARSAARPASPTRPARRSSAPLPAAAAAWWSP